MKLTKRFLIMCILFVPVLVLLSMFSYEAVTTITVHSFPTDVSFTNGTDLALGVRKGELHLGRVQIGGQGKSSFIIKNDRNEPVRIVAVPYTNFTRWLSFSENNFVLQAHENKTVDVFATPSSDAELTHYAGRIDVYVKRVFFPKV